MSIRKHTAYNLLGAVLPVGLSLFSIPIYIGLIGEARYGVLAVAWLLLGYFGLFDLGLGRATAQRIATLGGLSPEQTASTFWTALTTNVSLGIFGGLLIWPLAVYFFGHMFSVEAALRPELAAAIPWLVLAVPLATLSGVMTGALSGSAKFLELNIISVASATLIQLVPLAVAWLHGPDLAWLLPTVIFVRILTLSVLFIRCRTHVFKGQPFGISKALARGLLQFGGWVTVTSLVGPMMVILDRFIIGAALGAKAVTYYTVPFQLAERTTVLAGAVSSSLFPRLAAMHSEEGRELAGRAIRALAAITTPLTLCGVLVIDPFLRWWLSPEFAGRAGFSGQVLLLGFWVNGFASIPYAQLQASGRPDLVAKCHVGEVFPYLLLLYMGMHFFGLTGAAVVFGLRTFADWVLLMYFAGNLREGSAVLLMPAVLLLGGLGLTSIFTSGSFAWWAGALALVMLSWILAWSAAPPEIRSLLSRACSFPLNFKSKNL